MLPPDAKPLDDFGEHQQKIKLEFLRRVIDGEAMRRVIGRELPELPVASAQRMARPE
jgi:hypothetical protein